MSHGLSRYSINPVYDIGSKLTSNIRGEGISECIDYNGIEEEMQQTAL